MKLRLHVRLFNVVAGLMLAFSSAQAADLIIEMIIPAPGSKVPELFAIEVEFNEPVLGVDAEDLLVNGSPATNVIQVTPEQFLFSFEQPADGTVAVAWRADHGITDLEGVARPFAGGQWTYTLDSVSPASQVFISELMADNRRTLNDEDGDSSDWIEIFNTGPGPASLAGWFLTDDPNNLVKWRFPEVAIAEKGYLVVFASEKNKTNATGRLHTNFKLAVEGEYLALVDPNTNVVSEFAPAYPRQSTDVSYGRVPGEPRVLGFFTKPTPGAVNSAGGPGFAPAVDFSRSGGTFTNRFELTLSTVSANAVIRYTLDGTLPTNSSPVYARPILVTNSVQVRARAYQTGLLPGPPRTEGYLLLSNNVFNFRSDLPVMIIHTLGKGSPTSSRLTFAHLSVLEPVQGQTALTQTPVLTARAGIQIRGSSTEGYPKSSYKLELWDEFDLDKDLELLGLPADSDWVLYAPNNFDPVLIHNPFVHQLSRDLGQYSPRTRFVEVYLNKGSANSPVSASTYNGIYVLEEKIKIGPQRLAIDRLEPEHSASPQVTGGYLLKIDRLDPGDSGLAAGGVTMAYVDPKEREIKLPQRRPQQNYLRDYFTAFGKALSSANWRDPILGYPAYVDIEAWIDFHVLEVLSGNVDALVLSTYFHKPRNGKIAFGPHWDFDRALGSTDGRDANPRIWNTGPFFSPPWWNRLFSDKDFWQKWVDRWQELHSSHFSLTNIHGLIDRLANEVRQAQPREFARWRVTMRGGSYQSEINLMKNWLSNRIDFIDRQLTQPPRFSAAGGAVASGFVLTITGPTNATIYYDLNGADPRAPQGVITPTAVRYAGPIVLERNARVVARAYDASKKQTGGPPSTSSTPWSGPAAATFVVATPPLLLTEIMFHPAPPPAGSTNTASDFEFIELKNVSSAPLNLAGFQLSGGITFTFATSGSVRSLAPGEHVLLVKNRGAFLSRYPEATNIAGTFLGSLGNDRNRLTLTGPLQEPIFDLTYNDNWAKLADGFGFSLVLAQETTPLSQLGERNRWRLSACLGGSPGQVDPASPEIPGVRVVEALTRPLPPERDAVELYNPTDQTVNLADWYLTDDFRSPKKYRIPKGTKIGPNQLLVFAESQFGSAIPDGFALSSLGDEVFLFSGNADGELTGYFHGFEFGAAEAGVSFGLEITSDGQEHFVAQKQTTIGHYNAGAQVGPVVISEIMYHPTLNGTNDSVSDEYIELHNLSLAPVALFDPAHPTNTWQVRGAVDFEFPTNTILASEAHIVLVGFDPRTDLGKLATFRSRYHLSLQTQLFGPWRGQLDNNTGRIRLIKPSESVAIPSGDGESAPYVLVEQISYSSQAPWPTNASGTARSIARKFQGAYGDDPAHWFASAPSPGYADLDGDGLPDQWEMAYGLDPCWPLGDSGPEGDPDRDGFTNLQEFKNNTAPWDGPTYLRLETIPGNKNWLNLSFTAVPGHSYTVLFRDDLGSGSWQVLRTFAPSPQTTTHVITEPCANAARFYRLQVR